VWPARDQSSEQPGSTLVCSRDGAFAVPDVQQVRGTIHGGGRVSRIFLGRLRTGIFPSGHSLLTGICFAHFGHGISWPKRLVYLLVGVARDRVSHQLYAPGHSAPIIGDLTFFTLVWPHEAARR
jgi:hypothetical protein